MKKGTGGVFSDQRMAVTRRFLGAGGQLRCSGIREVLAFGVEDPAAAMSIALFSSKSDMACFEETSSVGRRDGSEFFC